MALPISMSCGVQRQCVGIHRSHITATQRQAAGRRSVRARVVPKNLKEEVISDLKPLDDIEKAEEEIEKGENFFAYVAGAVAFGGAIFAFQGGAKAEEFFAGYLLEQSLSIDNLFVFILCFNYFKTPIELQSRVLSVGIYSAAVLRLIMILAGVELVENFKPLLLVFAGILLYSSGKILFGGDEEADTDLNDNIIVKAIRKVFDVTDDYRGDQFTVIEDGVRKVTPLLLCLAVIEISDVIFAVDSIPAVFGVTLDPFIIYTSNMFAILSLRALFGFVNTVIAELRYLEPAVAAVLGFIGSKMIADQLGYSVSTTVSLVVVATLLGGGTAASLLIPEKGTSVDDV